MFSDVTWFRDPVPLTSHGVTVEKHLTSPSGQTRFHALAPGLRAVDHDTFNAIVFRGQSGAGFSAEPQRALEEPVTSALRQWEVTRRRVRLDLRRQCLALYDWRCMLSGRNLDLPEGGSLLAASHFHPLGRGGPDEIRNLGLKSAALHAMYEVGLFTILPNRSILMAPDLTPELRSEFRGRTTAAFPGNENFWPRPDYLDFHRVAIYEDRLKRLGL